MEFEGYRAQSCYIRPFACLIASNLQNYLLTVFLFIVYTEIDTL
jgi:hypothetical protein